MASVYEYAEAFRRGMASSFDTVLEQLEQAPEEMTAREAGRRFRSVQAELEARIVAEMDQVITGMDR